MLNRIVLIGRLTRDPEANYTPSGVPVTKFSIAVNRIQSAEARQQGREKETDFIDIVTWRQTAEYAANYLQKGKLVAVEGKLQIRSYVAQDGQQRKSTEVIADNVTSLSPRESGEAGDGGEGGGYSAPPAAQNRGGSGNYGGGSGGAPAGGGGNYGGAPAAGGGGGYSGGTGGAPAGGARPPAGGAARPPARNTPPPPSGDSFDDVDDLADPFAE